NVLPRSGLTFGWSCMSRRHPTPTISHKKAKKAQIIVLCFWCLFVAVRSDFDIIYFNCIQTLQQLNNLSVIELRIVCFDRQEEPVARRERKIRYVEYRMVRLRQLVEHQHSQHR